MILIFCKDNPIHTNITLLKPKKKAAVIHHSPPNGMRKIKGNSKNAVCSFVRYVAIVYVFTAFPMMQR